MSNDFTSRRSSGRRALSAAPVVLLFIQCGSLDERSLNEATGGSAEAGSGGVSSGGRGGSAGSGGTATGSAPGATGGSAGKTSTGGVSGSGAGGSAAADSGGSSSGGRASGGSNSGGSSSGGEAGGSSGGSAGSDSGGSAGAGGDDTAGGGDSGAGAGGCSGSDCGPSCSSSQKVCEASCIPSTGCCVAGDCPATATCSANACVCKAGYFGKACNYYFKGLAYGASTHTEGQANGVSGDGKVVVGWSKGPSTDTLAVRWIQETGSLLPRLSDGGEAMAIAANSDGSVIVGDSFVTNVVVAFRFQTSTNATTSLQLLPFASYNHATAVNADGTVIVGWGDNDGGEFKGLRWTNGTVASLSNIDSITPLATSSNGQILLGVQGSVAGTALLGTVRNGTIGGDAMRFTTSYALLDGGGVATASSSNGNIAAGYTGTRATRWTGTTAQDLGAGAAYAISGDGSIVVGAASNLAMIWDATNGARSLSTVLTQAGVDLTGWTLRVATGISTNGKVVVGNGQHGTATEPWIVRLP